MTANRLPPFSSVLKSRDVEDPINLWLHRPLAYLIFALIYRTPLTPNQVTLISGLLGLAATGCWIEGSPAAMVWGGALLWSSAIVDGVDGILARAKQMSSELGRVLDGTTDAAIGLFSTLAGFYHLWVLHHDPSQLPFMAFALLTTIGHVYLYDYYKESYMKQLSPSWNGRHESLADVEADLARARAERAPLYVRFSLRCYLDVVRIQRTLIRALDPAGNREGLQYRVDSQTAETYRRFNKGPIKFWSFVSVAPHMYLISICGMLDRLDLYLWYRVFGANTLFVCALLWQRARSRNTLDTLRTLDLAPVPAGSAAATR
jgi:phosphatidylglycerophosphate synthase